MSERGRNDKSADPASGVRAAGFDVQPKLLTNERVLELRSRVQELAASDRCAGTAWYSGMNQRVYDLANKGERFVDLAMAPPALAVVEALLGEYAMLSSLTAHVVAPGSGAQELHCDQEYVWRPWPYPVVVNVVWALDSFDSVTGGTRIVPGSHEASIARTAENVKTVVAPAGSAVFLDGRAVHGSGTNHSPEPRVAILALYCAPFLRQQENAARSLSRSVRNSLSARGRRLFGFDVWRGLGAVGGLPTEFMHKETRSGPINTDGAFDE